VDAVMNDQTVIDIYLGKDDDKALTSTVN